MSDGTAEFETALDLYRDRYRRVVLAVLGDEQRPLTLNDLTKTVIKHACDGSVTDVSDGTAERVRVSLYHVHLPKLAEAGLVEYDPEQKLVEPTERLDQVQSHLSALIAADPELDAPLEL